ncbi:MAG: amino acid racemase [Candidatus Brocadiae bacterium]|nr:amino acid racemase [Candidatus Brocadiia bacterium]
MAEHIGIVACSAEGAALCYRTICAEAPSVMGEHAHPEITMHTHALSDYMVHIRSGDWQGVAELMLSSVRKVAAAGARFAICPDNTVHQAFELVVGRSAIPWLHIARVVADEASRRGYAGLGILGTRHLTEGPVYPDALAPRGISVELPDEDDRLRMDSIIFRELVCGVFTEESRAYFNEVMERLKARGADAVVLACTEIPLIVRPEEAPLPILDSTRLLARAAIGRALGSEAPAGGEP